ncbi:MAG: hypothetical protein PUB70_00065 [Bacteroidales bacterium]|nr:hypothetical protein [Bacteroidales bacterium]MDD6508847.1 hypothetical protein [Bacteroidales bacterium]MDD6809488.1 hypothetical protein [Bacteroidales bacterium]
MDIDLLSKMVKELILVNDRVTLPGVGAFVAEMVPASFTDRGYTINPPYRRLVFRQGVSQEKDHLLADMYASANNIDREMAEKLLREFLKGMVEELRKRKMLVFTGLGRLRATRENNFFFICDENLDIFPEGMGLEAVSLKSHSKPKELDFSEVDAVVNSAAESPAEPAAESPADPAAESPTEPSAESPAEPSAEPAAEPVAESPAEPSAEPAAESPAEPAADSPAESPAEPRWWLGETEPEEEDEQHGSIWKKGWFVAVFGICCLLLLAALAFVLFLLLARTQPELIDSLLYTEEELEILNHIL